MSTAGKTIDIPDLINNNKIGSFQIGMLILCGLCVIMDGFDVQAMGYVAPAIIADWHVSKANLGPVFGAGLLGMLVGSQIAGWIPSHDLKWYFVVYAYVIALQMLADKKPQGGRPLPGPLGLWSSGGVIGVISSFVGIGGGSMSVPFMSWCNVPMPRAIATSAALGWPIAVAGAVGYVISGWHAPDLPPGAVGFVYLPGLLALSVVTVLVAPQGARLAHRLPVSRLKKVFAGLMAVMATQMLWTLVR